MSTDTQDEIERIIRQGFPDRPEVNAPFDFNSDADKAQILSEEFGAASAEHQAHLAVHKNDKWHRDLMRHTVAEKIRLGVSLYPAEQAWLVYLLGKIEDAPCECNNGRPIEGNEDALFRLALVAFILDDEIKNPDKKRGYVTMRLKRAANALSKSYEVVRKTYYAKSFHPLLERMKARGFNPLPVK